MDPAASGDANSTGAALPSSAAIDNIHAAIASLVADHRASSMFHTTITCPGARTVHTPVADFVGAVADNVLQLPVSSPAPIDTVNVNIGVASSSSDLTNCVLSDATFDVPVSDSIQLMDLGVPARNNSSDAPVVNNPDAGWTTVVSRKFGMRRGVAPDVAIPESEILPEIEVPWGPIFGGGRRKVQRWYKCRKTGSVMTKEGHGRIVYGSYGPYGLEF